MGKHGAQHGASLASLIGLSPFGSVEQIVRLSETTFLVLLPCFRRIHH